MPLVLVTRDPHKISKSKLVHLVSCLPKRVAEALHVQNVPEAHLTPEDIEVRVQEPDRFDIRRYDLEIVIFASHFPEREAELPQRIRHISEFVGGIFHDTGLSGFVYVLLAPAAFAEWRG